ncbi:ABC transporter permease [Bacillus sp. IITD106]|nr:ABC transporter permease [Bacillus sp. IITD106]
MNKLKYVFQNEGLLLLRNKFLAIPLLVNILYWGYVIISYEIQPIHFEERAAAFYQSFIWILFLDILIVGLFAVYMASKDRDSDFEQLVVTYEVKNVEWLLGKWLVTQLYGLCITIITIVVQAIWLISASMTLGDWFKNIFYVFIQMEGAFFLLISIGFLFGILIKSMLAYVSIPAILVLSLLLPFDYTGQAYIWDNPKFHLLTPFDYMFIGSPYEGIWGIQHVFKGTLFHQGAIVLLGFVVIILALLLFRRHRKSYKEKKLIPIIATIIIIPTIVLSGMRFMQYDQALKQYISTGQQYAKSFDGEGNYDEWMNSYYEVYKDDQPYDFAMEKTNLSVELQTNDHISVKSGLTIKNNGSDAVKDVFLTLYYGLKIKECTSEKSVSCSKDGDFITLHFEQPIQPDETFDLNLHYEGKILQYRDYGYVEHAFIKNERMYLPKEAGWYPLIGKRKLVVAREHNNMYAQFELRNARLVEDFPTEFSVTITRKNQKLPLALTIPEVSKDTFQGISQYGLSLVGGNFKEENVGDIRVVAHPEVFNGAKEVIERYQKAWRFTEDWLGIPLSPSVIYILSDRYWYLASDGANHDFFVMGSASVDDWDIAYELINEITPENFVDNNEDFRIINDAMVWTIMNHLHEQVSFADWYKSTWWVGDEDLTLVNLLGNYENKGLEPFKEVVKYLFESWKGLENKQDFDMEAALKHYEGDSKR